MILVILILVFIYNQFKFWWYGFWCFSVLLVGTFFKYIIQRPRPDINIDGYSFPSMHVLSVCLLVSLILLLKNNKWLTIICVLLVISIIISRIYLRAHFFTDTIGSILIIGIMLQALKVGNATSTQNNR
ncbi:phosphatase PAP2 family protein [Staphylococcus equorum]